MQQLQLEPALLLHCRTAAIWLCTGAAQAQLNPNGSFEGRLITLRVRAAD
jgi:hypothetical protein